jgi:uncharacterized membrane protein (DUF485 family)
MHENRSTDAPEDPRLAAARQRFGLILLFVFSSTYALFIGLCAFANQWIAKQSVAGVPMPVCFGLGLIFLALAMAGIYGRFTRAR